MQGYGIMSMHSLCTLSIEHCKQSSFSRGAWDAKFICRSYGCNYMLSIDKEKPKELEK